ncbi:hypothetical protein ABSA28_00893 [Candidatus Hepatincolaceae symbiont of Richtersius coronifer]
MVKALIYKPSRNAMQSGLGNTKEWLLILTKASQDQLEDLMKWTSTFDTSDQVKIYFDSEVEAVNYAINHHLLFEVFKPHMPKRAKKSYSMNFTKDRNLYY